MSNEKTIKHSFLDFIKNEKLNLKSIKIPQIQRDYAQGRKQSERVREDFLTAIFDAIKDGNELELDFVYGRIEGDSFIPLDGQQRLTTLFLLHCYAFFMSGEGGKFPNDFKFTYEVRETSREFCEKLINKWVANGGNIEKTPSSFIKNQNWFFESYLKDPTIDAMLNMLDAIHKKFSSVSDKMIDGLNKIKFYFLNLDEFNLTDDLTDDLYVKMNARGKPLDEFENFKAKFVGVVESICSESKKYIFEKLDGDWLDMFWNLSEKSNDRPAETNKYYFEFFKNCLINLYRKDLELDKKLQSKDKKYIDLGAIDDKSVFEYSLFSKCDKNKENIESMRNILDNLASLDENDDYFKSFSAVVRENNQADEREDKSGKQVGKWYLREKFFVTMKILSNENFASDLEYRKNALKFRRVCNNLIDNNHLNGTDDFVRTLELIEKLFGLCGSEPNFYERLKPKDPPEKDNEISAGGSLGKQLEEEKIKAKLICKENEGSNWKEAIEKAEGHWYLNGQIKFLLDYSKESEKHDVKKFIEYFDRFEKVFPKNTKDDDEQNRLEQNRLLQSALLALCLEKEDGPFYYYFISKLSTSIRHKTRESSWRYRVFNDAKMCARFKDIMLKSIDGLKQMVETKKQSSLPYKYFVENHKYFAENKNLREFMQHDYVLIIKDKENIERIYMFRKGDTSSAHEIFSCLLYENIKNADGAREKIDGKKLKVEIWPKQRPLGADSQIQGIYIETKDDKGVPTSSMIAYDYENSKPQESRFQFVLIEPNLPRSEFKKMPKNDSVNNEDKFIFSDLDNLESHDDSKSRLFKLLGINQTQDDL